MTGRGTQTILSIQWALKMQEPVSTIGAAGSLSLTGRRSSFPPRAVWRSCFVRNGFCQRKIWGLWQWKHLSDGSAWPHPGSWWFHRLTKSDYPRGPWNWSIRILKIFVMPRCYISEQRCQQGKSKSHSKPNKIKRYENMCSTWLLRSSQHFQGCLFQEVNGRKISPGMKPVYLYSKEIQIFLIWFLFGEFTEQNDSNAWLQRSLTAGHIFFKVPYMLIFRFLLLFWVLTRKS